MKRELGGGGAGGNYLIYKSTANPQKTPREVWSSARFSGLPTSKQRGI